VTSKSAITPWRSGRVAAIEAGVRPIIRSASEPTACTSPVSTSDATTEGSETTMPRPLTYTKRVGGAEIDRHVVHAERRREVAAGGVATGTVSTESDGNKGVR